MASLLKSRPKKLSIAAARSKALYRVPASKIPNFSSSLCGTFEERNIMWIFLVHQGWLMMRKIHFAMRTLDFKAQIGALRSWPARDPANRTAINCSRPGRAPSTVWITAKANAIISLLSGSSGVIFHSNTIRQSRKDQSNLHQSWGQLGKAYEITLRDAWNQRSLRRNSEAR